MAVMNDNGKGGISALEPTDRNYIPEIKEKTTDFVRSHRDGAMIR